MTDYLTSISVMPEGFYPASPDFLFAYTRLLRM